MTFLPLLAILVGLVVLVWSADRFVTGAAAIARQFGLAPLLIGMLVVGFGTSAPEMLVSALSAWEGASGIALGNAYGSNIVNIALILGLTALLSPIAVHSAVLRRELPILLGATLLTLVLVADLRLPLLDSVVLLAAFTGIVFWSVLQSRREPADKLAADYAEDTRPLPLGQAWAWTGIGLVVLIASSRLLVWGAVETATALGVSDLVIGLTVVAVGTSLPELASTLIAIRRREHDIALGNVIGSNLFNTLAVVGIAGLFGEIAVPPEVLTRDLPVMTLLTLALVLACIGIGRQGRLNRLEGGAFLAAFVVYTGYLVASSRAFTPAIAASLG